MPELKPLPIGTLARRMFLELQRTKSIFGMPAPHFWHGTRTGASLGVRVHGMPAGSPVGPAAGPHTQLAQNIVLAWLAGCRIFELKTIQANDRLHIPRPCIDAPNVAYNIEFSQELRLEESLEEYVKAWMLIRMLEHEEVLCAPRRTGPTSPSAEPNFYDTVFDLSVGYDMAGITGDAMQAVMRGLMDATATIGRLRGQLPDSLSHLRRIDYEPRIVSSVTLSTFHNCPVHEIGAIASFLLRDMGLSTVIKLNPTSLDPERLGQLLHDEMQYDDLEISPSALAARLPLDDAAAIFRGLLDTPAPSPARLGAKFCNTLEVLNHRDTFPKQEKVMYLSGPPLYPVALNQALAFRRTLGRDIALSFSGGVDCENVADVLACGFAPVTVCTDLLKVGGYQRLGSYMINLEDALQSAGARSLDEYVRAKALQAGATHDNDKGLAFHARLAGQSWSDSRYARQANSREPKHAGTMLSLFDCLACDRCVGVCPNTAFFAYPTTPSAVGLPDGSSFAITKNRQEACFGSFCNECGNCVTYCPQQGGPHLCKPVVFVSREQYEAFARDAFLVEREGEGVSIEARLGGTRFALRHARLPESSGDVFAGPFGEALVDPAQCRVIEVRGEDRGGSAADLRVYLTLRTILEGVAASGAINHVSAALVQQPQIS